MNSLMIMALVIMMIITILVMLLNLTAKKMIMDREKSSPFECGFDPKSSSRLPFSMHFFLIAIIFLIFDVEITLLLPMIVTLKFNNTIMYSVTLSFFIVILMVGLLHEWKQGALTWTN
uniref:NADH dehydrogenase subunit 3 n=1 Tax=Cteniopinus hypocrita TaxID=2969965 RepID=UPI002176E22F|nr:NADH dehydrogenase subunit 3 [Cteniopinus hypocrita]UUL71632.1 NADH dehydrogenase subunit 3 [Cteniopinus hypocrita]